ncbi:MULTISPECIES: DUF4400 domain-containing protein [unclassified Janthinobacterium]|uniref:DUF4400 domain-containing protein n=1 Tax=unclassified Janthinobacterium TaxID=2610881 RepID=UPI0025B2219B|nr:MULTISPECIES: DUF4400 domain-containing protein [unclassified Janthinobacterium]MDN2705680.1 DUF4400 domain-containing protein [Janthinobacterium sp. SUN100]MDO8040405.1 DUF4400 domain-containing protein [Janthinobacterium sp. SUN137]
MLIRLTAIVSLSVLLILVLYLPSAFPPQRFVAQIRAEHIASADCWGNPYAGRVLGRLFEYQAALAAQPASIHVQDVQVNPVAQPIANSLGRVRSQLFQSSYFRSLDTLTMLALYRLAGIVQWWATFAVLMMAFIVDAMVRRRIKRLGFARPHPEWFAAAMGVAILLVCLLAVACVLPVQLSPLLLPAMLGGVAWLAGRIVVHYA